MNRYAHRYALCVTISAAVLAGIAGAARAEVNEATAPAQQAVKSERTAPVPIPRPHPLAASRRSLTDQSAAAVTPLPQPSCEWFACAQYVIVGIGF
jgi:hypothetical protein